MSLESVSIPWQYGDGTDPHIAWEIEPDAINESTEEALQNLMWCLSTNVSGDHTEFGRIIKSAAALHELNKGTIGECLATAIIWERG